MSLLKEKKTHREQFNISILIAVILSIFVIHLPLIFFVLHQDLAGFRKLKPDRIDRSKLVMINLNDTPQLPQRIADIDKPLVQKKPDRASAQALYDSSVREETVSTRASKIPVGSKTPPPIQKRKIAKSKPVNKEVKKTPKKTPPQPSPETQSPEYQKSLGMQDKLKMIQDEHKQTEKKEYAELFEKQTEEAHPIFKTNLDSPGGGSSGDFFPDYKIGDRTYLNTLANPYIAYYVELRRKFRLAFNPWPVLRERINQISQGQISVIWGVSVDQNGNLAELKLIRGSGLNDYDLEAKRTISASAPFSRPPAHLLSKDENMLHMAWTFVMYL
ncbi:MAG: TonB C-terminal domain-containing protein [Deltaproteobacteria bacterium]|nr:TonB C-terminal domain-containing protein [Deltaproteobacteria bacterium]